MDAAESAAVEKLQLIVSALNGIMPASIGIIKDRASGKCNLVVNSRVPTLTLDKGCMYINPEFINKVDMRELMSLFIQELHCLVLRELHGSEDDDD